MVLGIHTFGRFAGPCYPSHGRVRTRGGTLGGWRGSGTIWLRAKRAERGLGGRRGRASGGCSFLQRFRCNSATKEQLIRLLEHQSRESIHRCQAGNVGFLEASAIETVLVPLFTCRRDRAGRLAWPLENFGDPAKEQACLFT